MSPHLFFSFDVVLNSQQLLDNLRMVVPLFTELFNLELQSPKLRIKVAHEVWFGVVLSITVFYVLAYKGEDVVCCHFLQIQTHVRQLADRGYRLSFA